MVTHPCRANTASAVLAMEPKCRSVLAGGEARIHVTGIFGTMSLGRINTIRPNMFMVESVPEVEVRTSTVWIKLIGTAIKIARELRIPDCLRSKVFPSCYGISPRFAI